MHALRWERRPQSLRSPALVCAFKGWNDAGECASAALSFLGSQFGAKRFATIDPEEYVDFQSARPMIRLTETGERELTWPEFELHEVRAPGAPRDLILLTGPEPALHWRAFCEGVIELSDVLGVRCVVTLGSLLADVPHSRPVALTGLASNHALLERMGLEPPNYEGPTGIVGVMHSLFSDADFPTASLWAAVPHYVAVTPNPKGALALLRKLETLVDVGVDASELEKASEDHERQVSRAVELDSEIRAYVERLEQSVDESQVDVDSIPSGEVLAREFQRLLRQRSPGEGE